MFKIRMMKKPVKKIKENIINDNGKKDRAGYPASILKVISLVLSIAFLFSNVVFIANADNENYVTHVVQKGDTLSKLARSYGVTLSEILKFNNFDNPSEIIPGQTVKIPKTNLNDEAKEESTIIQNPPEENTAELKTAEKSTTQQNITEYDADKQITAQQKTTETNTAEKDTAKQNAATPENENGDTASVNTSTNSRKDSGAVKTTYITFKNADLRDILSALAMAMDVNIVLIEEPVKMSFEIRGVSPGTALEYLLKTIGMEYVKDGKLLVVGKPETLKKGFLDQMAISRFDLKYITSDVVSNQIDKLEIPVKKVVIDDNNKAIWLQGTPQSLSKAKELITLIDIEENSPKKDTDEGEDEAGIKLSSFQLEYITAETLDKLITDLGIDADTIIVDSNPRTIWVDAEGQALKDIENLINAVDVIDNYAYESDLPLELVPYSLNFISPEELVKLINEMKIDVKTIYFKSNPGKIWVDARSNDISDFEELVVKVDLIENTEWPLNIEIKTLKNITSSKLKAVADELGLTAQIVTLESSSHTVWLIGDRRQILDVNMLINQLDNNSVNEAESFFTYHLISISPAEAVKRFGYLNVEDTTLIALNYAAFSKEVLVICPSDRKEIIMEILSQLDTPGTKIRVPVDFSDSHQGKSRLAARRDLLVSLTQIPATSFYISDNVSRDEKPYYIMWVEETPDNILKIKNMIDAIANP